MPCRCRPEADAPGASPIRFGYLFAVLVVLGTARCGDAAAASSPQVALVARLYQRFAYEAVLQRPPQPGLRSQPRRRLQRYFTPGLSGLLRRDQRCVERSGAVCRLDFLPLWDSQDAAGTAVDVEPGATPDRVRVTLHGRGASRRVVYRLVRLRRGWRIHDIDYAGRTRTLRGLLGAPPTGARRRAARPAR